MRVYTEEDFRVIERTEMTGDNKEISRKFGVQVRYFVTVYVGWFRWEEQERWTLVTRVPPLVDNIESRVARAQSTFHITTWHGLWFDNFPAAKRAIKNEVWARNCRTVERVVEEGEYIEP